MAVPTFAARGSGGLAVFTDAEKGTIAYQQTTVKANKTALERGPDEKQIRCHLFSPDGNFYAYCDGENTTVLSTVDWKPYWTLGGIHAHNNALHFSPASSFLCTYQTLFSTRQPNSSGAPVPLQQRNLHVLDLKHKTIIGEFMDKNRTKWQPIWTNDETICARLVGSELLFHELNDFSPGSYKHKLVLSRMTDFSLSGTSKPLHVAAYVPVAKDTPAAVKIFSYPYFSSPIAAKTFFKADRVNMQWNKKGNALIITAILDIDSTGESYYGSSNLYFVSTNNDSYMVDLKKNGPVYSVEWSPNSLHYCVVYGYMPAKATLYNLKGDVVFDFGTGLRNDAHYDPLGKLIALCGFGNLRGPIEIWGVPDGQQKNQTTGILPLQRLCSFKAEDTTLFQWCPDGIHILTATTTPRLRVNNGWTIWRYNGTKVAHMQYGNSELWDVIWKPNPAAIEQPLLTFDADVSGTVLGQSKPAAYVPPHLRGVTNKPSFKLHQFEPSTSEKQAAQQQDTTVTKNVLKNRKRLENKRQKKEAEKCVPQQQVVHNPSLPPPTITTPSKSAVDNAQSPDHEKNKKIRNLNKKLDQIAAYKERIEKGDVLELNQMEKVKMEDELRRELESLTLSP